MTEPPDPSSADSYAADLALGLSLADAADAATLHRFRAVDLVVETKPDLTPVSDADKAVEVLLRDLLASARPGDGVVGEEMADTAGTDGRRWVLDPIDGTASYVRGVPVWATLVGLVVDGRPVVGVVSAPALGRRWWAAEGSGAWLGGPLGVGSDGKPRRLQVSGVRRLADASLSYSDVTGWPDGGTAFRDLAGRCWRTRAYGDFWSHLLVAEGAVDVAVEPDLSLWDVAALVPVVREAGGQVTGWTGLSVLDGYGAVSSNAVLHEEALEVLAAAQP